MYINTLYVGDGYDGEDYQVLSEREYSQTEFIMISDYAMQSAFRRYIDDPRRRVNGGILEVIDTREDSQWFPLDVTWELLASLTVNELITWHGFHRVPSFSRGAHYNLGLFPMIGDNSPADDAKYPIVRKINELIESYGIKA